MKDLTTFLAEQLFITTDQGEFSISTLDNPKVTFAEPGNQEFTDDLIDMMQVIVAESFGVEPKNKSRDGIRNHVITVDSLAILHQQNKIVGFASSKLFPLDDTFYLHGVAVAPHLKGKGAGAMLVRTLADRAGLKRIAFTTQNPLMFCLLRSLLAKIFPSPGEKMVPSQLREVGTRLVFGRSGNFDPVTFIIRYLYGNCLYDSLPISRDVNVNRWFTDALNVVNGITRDGFLFIGENA
ncbi:MAG: GNAT family N-acetyltransferase [bacterium]|nr:GNAT family N-acetyltransferase [bacterium]